jgi:UDP-N-acetylmuramoylalanine--D-glutamate ligase
MNKRFDKEWWKGKQVLVLGLAKSGLAVAGLLNRLGAHVTVNDQKPIEELTGVDELRALGIQVFAGAHPEGLLHKGLDMIVKNPGIPYTSPLIQAAVKLEIPIITEVEVSYQIASASIVGITGSNGKTTTTTLVGKILEEAKLRPIVAGNIGTVLCEKAESAQPNEILVAELSSFQLKGTIDFRPNIACLLNIIPAHLDYHQTWEDYIASKRKLFDNLQQGDAAVLNADQQVCKDLGETLKCSLFWFSRQSEVEHGSYVRDGHIYFRDLQGVEEAVMPAVEIGIPGAHNLENALAAVTICKILKANNNAIRNVLSSFRGVEHRLEYVAEIKGVTYYNNSKATNTEATIKGLESFHNPIVLIAGGLDRGTDFLELVPHIKNSVKGIVAYGQTKEKFIQIGKLAGLNLLSCVDNVDIAVIRASEMADSGDVVLLSPACASWDMYDSFEQRGSIFKESVHKLKTSLH